MRADVRGKVQSFTLHPPMSSPPSPRHSGESRRFSGRNVHPEGRCKLGRIVHIELCKEPLQVKIKMVSKAKAPRRQWQKSPHPYSPPTSDTSPIP